MMAHMDGVVAAELARMVRFWIHVKIKPVGFLDGQDVACEGVRPQNFCSEQLKNVVAINKDREGLVGLEGGDGKR